MEHLFSFLPFAFPPFLAQLYYVCHAGYEDTD